MADHYFSADPQGAHTTETITVTLAGREVQVVTGAGVFARDRLDLGTRVLLRAVPAPPPAGDLLDLGCGWGPIALTMSAQAPQARVWAVDVNPRALELTQRNALALRLPGIQVAAPTQVPDDVRFAAIWSNPPIRIGKAALHDLLLQWLPRLAEGAAAYLVVQRHLGADSLQRWLTDELPGAGGAWSVGRLGSAKGYRVLHVVRSGE